MSRTDGDGTGRVSGIGDGGQLAIDTGLWSDDAAAEAAGVGAGPMFPALTTVTTPESVSRSSSLHSGLWPAA